MDNLEASSLDNQAMTASTDSPDLNKLGAPERLTQAEIDRLRQHGREVTEFALAAFKSQGPSQD